MCPVDADRRPGESFLIPRPIRSRSSSRCHDPHPHLSCLQESGREEPRQESKPRRRNVGWGLPHLCPHPNAEQRIRCHPERSSLRGCGVEGFPEGADHTSRHEMARCLDEISTLQAQHECCANRGGWTPLVSCRRVVHGPREAPSDLFALTATRRTRSSRLPALRWIRRA